MADFEEISFSYLGMMSKIRQDEMTYIFADDYPQRSRTDAFSIEK